MGEMLLSEFFRNLKDHRPLNQMEPNLSPLRGQPDVSFVNTPEELAEALQKGQQDTVSRPDSNDFFFLDQELPRWRKLLTT